MKRFFQWLYSEDRWPTKDEIAAVVCNVGLADREHLVLRHADCDWVRHEQAWQRHQTKKKKRRVRKRVVQVEIPGGWAVPPIMLAVTLTDRERMELTRSLGLIV